MPTGYTSYIESGEITSGAEFLKLCTRAFGVAVQVRDEPLSVPTPTHFEPDNYYLKRLESALQHWEEVKLLTFNDMKLKMSQDYTEQVLSCRKHLKDAIELNEKYEKIKKQIELWAPPSKEHQSLKRFALEQIEMSMKTQKELDYYLSRIETPLDISDEAVRKQLRTVIDNAKQDVEHAYNSWKAELERVDERNKYMEQLMESLKKLEESTLNEQS